MSTVIPEISVPALAGRKEWIGLAVLALPTLLISMDTTVIYLALPEISAALQPGNSQLLWITDIYGFMEAGFLITMGTLGDRIGRRKLLLAGAVCFAIASVFAAFSSSTGMLIAARGLLGVAGATLLPSTLAILRNMFHDDKQRTMAIGIWTTFFSAGTVLGPFVGGLLLTHFWWGSVFLMGAPVMLAFIIVGPMFFPEFKDPHPGTFDLLSVALLLFSVLSFVYGIKSFAESGPTAISAITLAVGVIAGLVFLRRQQVLAHPLIDMTLFRIRKFNAALIVLALALFTWAGIFFFVGQYLQLVLGLSPFKAGLATIPSALMSIVSCITAPILVKHFNRGNLTAAGLSLMGAGLLVLSFVDQDGLPLLICAGVLISAGCGMLVTINTDIVVAAAPPNKTGAAAGISETCTNLGSSLGIALLGSIGAIVYRMTMADVNIPGLSADLLEPAKQTIGNTRLISDQLDPARSHQLIEAAKNAFIRSFQITGLFHAATLLISALVAKVVLPGLFKQEPQG
ncbi:MFS transporter [Pedobacter sp. HMF7647]|uniref:MFS transporter n=1 Tax=Hufsiella arboris TaxID=2695275 RepID=A0A7K1YB09_9SPHI|nr:MFS transporter [Hufsiella arboris]MXV51531.1 MFS transporter [Hufsiella arboris]